MDRKGTDIAYGLRDHPARTRTLKEAFQAFRRHRIQLRQCVMPRARNLQRILINIGRKDLQPGRATQTNRIFTEQHCD